MNLLQGDRWLWGTSPDVRALEREDESERRAAAMKFALLRMKMVVEPSGAVAMAATMTRKLPPELKRVGIIVSGGNVDYEMLASL